MLPKSFVCNAGLVLPRQISARWTGTHRLYSWTFLYIYIFTSVLIYLYRGLFVYLYLYICLNIFIRGLFLFIYLNIGLGVIFIFINIFIFAKRNGHTYNIRTFVCFYIFHMERILLISFFGVKTLFTIKIISFAWIFLPESNFLQQLARGNWEISSDANLDVTILQFYKDLMQNMRRWLWDFDNDLIKVCIPPEEEALSSKACEIHYCFFVVQSNRKRNK